MKDVEVLTGPPGCGKSHRMRQDAIRNPGRYVFFLPTLPLLREQVEAFSHDAPWLQTYQAHSGYGRGAVQRKLNDAFAAVEAANANHAVIFTTHDALMMRDLSAFKDWQARIDEAPNAAKSGVIPISESAGWFDSYFRLEPVGETGWSNLELKGPAPNWTAVARDKLLKSLVDFIKLASSTGGVFVKATEWANVDRLPWWSIWTPSSLSHFDTIQIAGASYDFSIGAIVAKKWFSNKIKLKDMPIPMPVSPNRSVRIHYFTRGHRPATTFWETSEGRRMVKAVCDYLGDNVPDLGFWSGNAEVLKLMEWRISGEQTLPKVLGQNRWRDLTKCAFIYSSGQTPDDEPLLEMFGLTEEQIRRAREDEDVLQFVMRGALRKPDFDGTFDAYLYTQEQATRLEMHLRASDVNNVELIPLTGAGIMDVERPSSDSRKKKAASPSSPVATKAEPQLVLNPKTQRMVLPKSLKRDEQRTKKSAGQPKAKRGRPKIDPT